MTKNHMAVIAAPKTWKLERKEMQWITRPRPGTHPLKESMPLSYVIKNLLNNSQSTRETKKILNDANVKVDNTIRKYYKFGVGLMDIVEVEKLGQIFRVSYARDGTLKLFEIEKKESNLKLLKVIRKTMLGKSRIQVTFHDGRNLIFDKTKLKVGDGILFD